MVLVELGVSLPASYVERLGIDNHNLVGLHLVKLEIGSVLAHEDVRNFLAHASKRLKSNKSTYIELSVEDVIGMALVAKLEVAAVGLPDRFVAVNVQVGQ